MLPPNDAPPTSRRGRGVALAAVAALLALVLVGCSGSSDTSAGPVGPARVDATTARRLEQAVLDQRATAVRQHDLRAFLSHVDRHDRALVRRQKQLFANLVQLPLATYSYRVGTTSWDSVGHEAHWGDDTSTPHLTLRLQLAGFDAVPVERSVGYVFSLTDSRATIVSDRTAAGRPLRDGPSDPWDLTRVTVRRSGGVLGVFDSSTRASAGTVLAAVNQGIRQLSPVLPFTWSEHVVVYSVHDSQVLRSFTDVPGGSIDHLGAMTFPTYVSTTSSRIASMRMLVLPSSVAAGQPFLGRITRHELTHAAIGPRDDGSPTWVSEGIAEYMGARDVPPAQRIIPTEALSRAAGPDEGMPSSKDFNDTDQAWHYALSWMAFDYICATYGESRMWELMDAMHNDGAGTSDSAQDRVLQQVLGYGSRELAKRAAKRITSIYG